jgi:hypothetical protein
MYAVIVDGHTPRLLSHKRRQQRPHVIWKYSSREANIPPRFPTICGWFRRRHVRCRGHFVGVGFCSYHGNILCVARSQSFWNLGAHFMRTMQLIRIKTRLNYPLRYTFKSCYIFCLLPTIWLTDAPVVDSCYNEFTRKAYDDDDSLHSDYIGHCKRPFAITLGMRYVHGVLGISCGRSSRECHCTWENLWFYFRTWKLFIYT